MKDVSFLKYFNFIKNSVLYLRLWENFEQFAEDVKKDFTMTLL